MSEDQADNPGRLPLDVLTAIKRKSSRDPMSRFSNKLHLLLTHAGDDSDTQERIGAGWVTDTTFRLHKKRLGLVMELKQNSLNVNLKDLKFRQLQTGPDGWTVWDRGGFTRQSTCEDFVDGKGEKDGDRPIGSTVADDLQLIKLAMLQGMSFGWTDSAAAHNFKRFTIAIWEELVPAPAGKYFSSYSAVEFLAVAAERFRASRQKLENSVEILRVVLTGPASAQLSLLDFAKFMAKFGPEETLMQKIDSLLKSSNNNQNWLKISNRPVPAPPACPIYGYFDQKEDNCFVIHRLGQAEERIYNVLDAAATDDFLVDANGQRFHSWQHYFQVNPIPKEQLLPTLQFDF
jgi:hypothetical protein